MKRRVRALALAMAASGFAGLASLTAPSIAAAAQPYDINVILPLTGGAAFLGKEEQEALQLAQPTINKAGGIHNRSVHFVFYDDQSDPQTSVQLTNRVTAESPAPAVVLGSSLVSSCNAMAPLAQTGPVLYCFSPGIHPSSGSYVFTSSISTGDLARALIRYYRLKGWTKIAIMTSADATGQDAERGLDQVLALPENKSVSVVARAHFNITDMSVAAQIEHIKEAHPQAMIAWSTGSPIATVFKGVVQGGLDIPIATTDGNMTYAQMKQYASFLPKQLYIPAPEWVEHQGVIKLDPKVEKAQSTFFDTFKAAGRKPDIGATLAWDPAMIVVHALRNLPPTAKAEQVRSYIAGLKNYAGVDGLYDFPQTPQRGLNINGAVVTRWSASHHTWELVSKPTGTPLNK